MSLKAKRAGSGVAVGTLNGSAFPICEARQRLLTPSPSASDPVLSPSQPSSVVEALIFTVTSTKETWNFSRATLFTNGVDSENVSQPLEAIAVRADNNSSDESLHPHPIPPTAQARGSALFF